MRKYILRIFCLWRKEVILEERTIEYSKESLLLVLSIFLEQRKNQVTLEENITMRSDNEKSAPQRVDEHLKKGNPHTSLRELAIDFTSDIDEVGPEQLLDLQGRWQT